MRYLLDANIVSALVNDPDGPVTERIGRHRSADICTSIIVAAEVRFGARRRNSARLTERVQGVLTRLEVLALEPPADAIYADLRTHLERLGQMIGAHDLFIAAHCLALEFTLVTDNVREFSRVPKLAIENWLRDF